MHFFTVHWSFLLGYHTRGGLVTRHATWRSNIRHMKLFFYLFLLLFYFIFLFRACSPTSYIHCIRPFSWATKWRSNHMPCNDPITRHVTVQSPVTWQFNHLSCEISFYFILFLCFFACLLLLYLSISHTWNACSLTSALYCHGNGAS